MPNGTDSKGTEQEEIKLEDLDPIAIHIVTRCFAVRTKAGVEPENAGLDTVVATLTQREGELLPDFEARVRQWVEDGKIGYVNEL